MNDQPCPAGQTGTRTSVSSSFEASAVLNGATKKSSAAIVRWPFWLRATKVAPSTTATAGSSEVGSACARFPPTVPRLRIGRWRSEEHTSELQSQSKLVCRLLLVKKKKTQ